ncbi:MULTISPECIES: helix-turn-helix domain-containing protein [Streptomyces]|uniref:Helix-turn-helix domain-containing protein n=2 Tax=Streptomyces TaxID=1883 RepID=A0ABV9IKS8_9ACTN
MSTHRYEPRSVRKPECGAIAGAIASPSAEMPSEVPLRWAARYPADVERAAKGGLHMSVNTAGIVARRTFGDALKAFRTESDHKIKQIEISRVLGRSTVDRYSRFERGAALPDDAEWQAIVKALHMDPEAKVRLETLLRAARDIEGAWWREFEEEFDESLLEFVAYEDAATKITTCAGNVLPGILQRRPYAEALTLSLDKAVLSPHQMDRSAHLRGQRRGIFDKSHPPTVEAIIGEGALRQEVGGKTVMVSQLDSLIEDAEAGRVSFRIIPFTASATLTHMFTLLEFGGAGEKPIVAFDAMTGMTFRKSAREIRELRSYIESLRELARSPLASLELLRSIRKELSR